MVQIFIEANRVETPEGAFLKALIQKFVPDAYPYTVNAVNGWTNLCQAASAMVMRTNVTEGGKNLVVFDADTKDNGGGYEQRLKELKEKLAANKCEADIFLWPDNHSDGDVEDLMLAIARKDLHATFFDCFGDYETCIKGVKDTEGKQAYHSPDKKAKVFTYISSMPLTNSQRKHLGRGEWLFSDPKFWNLESDFLAPIAAFLRKGLSFEISNK